VRSTCVVSGPAGLHVSLLMKLRDPQHGITPLEPNAHRVVQPDCAGPISYEHDVTSAADMKTARGLDDAPGLLPVRCDGPTLTASFL
jgi:hypothetical protein